MYNTWQVEVSKDNFQTVMADYATVEDGTLVFHKLICGVKTLLAAYAAGQWLTVVTDA